MARKFNYAVLARSIEDKERTIAAKEGALEDLRIKREASPNPFERAYLAELIESAEAEIAGLKAQLEVWKKTLNDPDRTRPSRSMI